MKRTTLVLCLMLASAAASAAPVTVSSVTGSGVINHSPSLIADGVVPREGTSWTAATNAYWNGTSPYITLAFDQLYTLQDVTVSVDNNDGYRISTSLDGIDWTQLFLISSSNGEIGFGMDTMSSLAGNGEYVSAIDFSPVNARYARIQATGGDNAYSVGELSFTGAAVGSTVPEPASLALLGLGLAGMATFRRRSKTR